MIRIASIAAVLLISLNATAQTTATVPEWGAGALALVPPGQIAGDILQADVTDPETPAGYIALYPAGADDPKSPGSAFDPGMMLVVKLARNNGRLSAMSAEVMPRDINLTSGSGRVVSAARDEAEYRSLDAELLAKAKALPGGTMPCDLHAWSTDTDPNGLNVRAQPSAKSKVLGKLPPPYTFRSRGGNVPDGGWLTEFAIIGFKDGWFLIEGATPPGKDYEDDTVYPRNHPRPYAGRGWVAASKVGAAFANGDTRMGGLFQAPHADARWIPAKRVGGSPLDTDGGPKRIFACSGFWALVESPDGVRGWWRRLCSNQVTNCS